MTNGESFAPRPPRLFLDDPEAVQSGHLIIRGSAARRLGRVLRLRRDDALEVIYADRFFLVQIARITEESVEAEVQHERPVEPEPAPAITLCPSLIRPQRFDFVLEKTTELGVQAIHPVRAERSAQQAQGRERQGRWRRLITEASEQCCREYRPAIEEPLLLSERAAQPMPPHTLRLVAAERERARRVSDAVAATEFPDRVEILVGPEGGLTPEETALTVAHGWVPVTLGPRPLRAETASVVAIAVVQEALLARSARRPD